MGLVGFGWARLGVARQGITYLCGMARLGAVGSGMVRSGGARFGRACIVLGLGLAWLGLARYGWVWLGLARRGEAGFELL